MVSPRSADFPPISSAHFLLLSLLIRLFPFTEAYILQLVFPPLSFSYNPSASPQPPQGLSPSSPALPKASSFQPFSELIKDTTDGTRVTQELRYSFLTHFVFLLPKLSPPLFSVSVLHLSLLPRALWMFCPSKCNSAELSIFFLFCSRHKCLT